MLRHRLKITIVVEKRDAILNAPGADEQVDGLAHRDSKTA
jgi:hypothetical protein